jgi:hypothetical protein
MGLLDFFVRKDPTHDWPASHTVPLRLDVVRGELNGIGFDVPFDALRVLGKPSNAKPVKTQLFAYAPLGLGVALGDEFEVIVFICVFQPEAGGEVDEFPGFAPCRITLHGERGMLLEVTTSTSLGVVEAALGPFERWETEDGHVASFVAGSVWMRFIFDHAGRLALLEFEPAGNEPGEAG